MMANKAAPSTDDTRLSEKFHAQASRIYEVHTEYFVHGPSYLPAVAHDPQACLLGGFYSVPME